MAGKLVIIKDGKDEFNKLLQDTDKLIVVDFYADWCGPCRMMAPTFANLANEFDAVFVKVNVDECSEIAEEYEVSGIPHFVLIKGGKKLDCFSGANKEKLLELINKCI